MFIAATESYIRRYDTQQQAFAIWKSAIELVLFPSMRSKQIMSPAITAAIHIYKFNFNYS